MTKKDYIIIAKAINEAMSLRDETLNPTIEAMALKTFVHCLLPKLQADNPRFEASKFIAMSGITLEF